MTASELRQLIDSFWFHLSENELARFQQENDVKIVHVGLNNVVIASLGAEKHSFKTFVKFPWRKVGSEKIKREYLLLSKLREKKSFFWAPRVLSASIVDDVRHWRYDHVVTPSYECSLKDMPSNEQVQRKMARILHVIHQDGARHFLSLNSKKENFTKERSKMSWLQQWIARLQAKLPRDHWLQSVLLELKSVRSALEDRYAPWLSSPTGLCHGDAALRNWCRDDRGRFVLIDWEDWTFGSIELDVAMLLVESNHSRDVLDWTPWRYLIEEIFPHPSWIMELPFLVMLLLVLIQNWIWTREYLNVKTRAPVPLQPWLPYSEQEAAQYLNRIEDAVVHVRDVIAENRGFHMKTKQQ